MVKKTRKKASKKTAKKTETNGDSLPQSANIPAGMKQMGGGYAPTWAPDEIGESLHGEISALPKEVTLKHGRKTSTTRVMEVTDKEGGRHAVWESAVLGSLFDEVVAAGDEGIGIEVFIQFDGLGKKKPGQNPPKLFTVAIAE